jgi:phosphoserine phosphatase
MLEAVGHPVVVNPGSKLRARAEQLGWTVVSWERTDPRRPPA